MNARQTDKREKKERQHKDYDIKNGDRIAARKDRETIKESKEKDRKNGFLNERRNGQDTATRKK